MVRTEIILYCLTAASIMTTFTKISNGVTGAGLVDYCGYTNCVKLENADTRVILGPHCGGRVLEYSLNGKNSLYIDPNQNGWVHQPGKDAIDPSGGRLDIGPEKTIPPHPDLWLGPWTAEITGPRAARMTSRTDSATGTQLVREFTLDDSSSMLTVTQIIKNTSSQPKHWCHWSRTLAVGGGVCIIPITPDSRLPNKYIMYEQDSLINYQPRDPNIRVLDNFVLVTGTPKNPKLGLDSYAGWLVYLVPNDLLFVKRFPTYPDRPYNEIAAITISIWYYKDIMCELEPIGPKENIAPGRSVSFTEYWYLLPYSFPKDRAAINPDDIARILPPPAN